MVILKLAGYEGIEFLVITEFIFYFFILTQNKKSPERYFRNLSRAC